MCVYIYIYIYIYILVTTISDWDNRKLDYIVRMFITMPITGRCCYCVVNINSLHIFSSHLISILILSLYLLLGSSSRLSLLGFYNKILYAFVLSVLVTCPAIEYFLRVDDDNKAC